ncbi:hypothetical protein [Hymenobacter glacieicola]|uniref:Gliding motility-associated protein GldM C-terminal domain-containing protein n=1 Tax=Hymenobacter glacieicola TaxID=1562124 RepID=A0ABQ1X7S8_9BACT|nr:hypothetical protein [Hymenobacter glacieicola]GGG59586.1 hypothetical protein GCM10011378_39470 [Hymenobacter glacieicola]
MYNPYSFLLALYFLPFGYIPHKATRGISPAQTAGATPNTATVAIDGKPFIVDVAASTLTLNTQSRYLTLTLNATTGSRIQVIAQLENFKKTPGRYVIADPISPSGLYFTETVNSRVESFEPRMCPAGTRTVHIEDFNEKQHRIRGTFSGIVCNGRGRTVQVTKGEFNLPFETVH